MVVRRGHYHACIRILRTYFVSGIGYTRRGIAHKRLAQYLVGRYGRQLRGRNIAVYHVGDYVYVFLRNHFLKAAECLLYKSFTCAEYVEELFGCFPGTHRVKAAAHTSGHYDRVIILVYHRRFFPVS